MPFDEALSISGGSARSPKHLHSRRMTASIPDGVGGDVNNSGPQLRI